MFEYGWSILLTISLVFFISGIYIINGLGEALIAAGVLGFLLCIKKGIDSL